ncbi:MAG TPA: NUDIX hydrolase [Candidatus Saccharimonadales bacterium]|nr:NUDIX hydrolase [Candidatus Saccharimonadales bacterium]
MDAQCYYRISVKGIAIDETGRFLLSREDDGFWDLLGGGLDHEEDPIAGLRREIQEETGLKVTEISPAPKYFVTGKRYAHNTYIANVIYEIKLESLDFTPSEECQELRFFTVAEAQEIDVFPTVKKFLAVYNPAHHLAA